MQNKYTSMRPPRPLISVIVPVFNEEENVDPVCDALGTAARSIPDVDWEFIFIEDGSIDETFNTLHHHHQLDPRVKIIQLSRNFGSHVSAAAGLNFASGDAAVIMAADLQDHPREISRFIEHWRKGADVVWAVRRKRGDSVLDRFLSLVFARVIRFVALPNYPLAGTGSFCILDRVVVDALNQFPEHNRATFGLILYSGFSQVEIEYDREARAHGKSKWSFRKKIRLLIDTVVSFSTTPIKLASMSGIVIAMLGMFYASYIVMSYILIGPVSTPGWSSLIVLVMLLGGFQLIVLGMLGEYISRSVNDVRRRPLFLIRRKIGSFERKPETASSPPTISEI